MCVCVYMQIDVWNKVIKARWWSALSLSLFTLNRSKLSPEVDMAPLTGRKYRKWARTYFCSLLERSSVEFHVTTQAQFSERVHDTLRSLRERPTDQPHTSDRLWKQYFAEKYCDFLFQTSLLFARLSDTLWSDQTTTPCLTSWTCFRVDYFTYL